MAVVRDGPKFELLALNDLKEEIYASPAVVGEDLFVGTADHLLRSRSAMIVTNNAGKGMLRHLNVCSGCGLGN